MIRPMSVLKEATPPPLPLAPGEVIVIPGASSPSRWVITHVQYRPGTFEQGEGQAAWRGTTCNGDTLTLTLIPVTSRMQSDHAPAAKVER